MKVTWKTMSNYPDYEINDIGEVRKISDGNYLTRNTAEGSGALRVTLKKMDGKPTAKQIKYLLAETFLSKPHKKAVLRLKDEDENNVTLDNLYWSKAGSRIPFGIKEKEKPVLATSLPKEEYAVQTHFDASFFAPLPSEEESMYNEETKRDLSIQVEEELTLMSLDRRMSDLEERLDKMETSLRKPEERWKSIPDALDYEVSDKGRVRNIRTKDLLDQSFSLGDQVVRLYGHEIRPVKGLVLNAFGQARGKDIFRVIHIDGDETNCTLENIKIING